MPSLSALRIMASLSLLATGVACGPKTAPEPQPAPSPTKSETSKAAVDPDAEPRIKHLPQINQTLVKGPPLSAELLLSGLVGEKRALVFRLPEDWLIQAREAMPEDTPQLYDESIGLQLNTPAAQVRFVQLAEDRDTPAENTPSHPKGAASKLASSDHDLLWLLLEDNAQPQQLEGSLLVGLIPWAGKYPAVEMPLKMTAKEISSENLEVEWALAVATYLENGDATSFAPAGAESLRALHSKKGKGNRASTQDSRSRRSDWLELMELSSGYVSVEAAMAHRTRLKTGRDKFRPAIELQSLTGPTLKQHAWKKMRRGLTMRPDVPELSKSVPADFYFIHARDGQGISDLIDEMDSFLSPAAHVFDQDAVYRGISERYMTALGVKRSDLARALGPQIIEEMAIVGSDPFLRLGSDVTLIFEAKSASSLAIGLDVSLRESAKGHGKLETTKLTLGAHEVTLAQTKDRAVHRLYFRDGKKFILSNSHGAMSRVLSTHSGNNQALSSEDDFLYMLARDQKKESDILAYAGDRFIASIVSPRSRILDARRALARAELVHVSQLALTRGLLGEEVVADPASLIKSGLLTRRESIHFDGQKIQAGPSSAYGTPRHMRPLIDLPTPKQVSEQEAQAYQSFADGYQREWGEVIDPIALRLTFDEKGKGFEAHLRVLPLLETAEYGSIAELVGDTRLDMAQPGLGMQLAFALAKDSPLRNLFSRSARGFLEERLSFDWLGDYVMLGIEDRSEIANDYLERMEKEGDMGIENFLSFGEELPLYIAIDVSSRKSADLLLTTLKHTVKDADDIVELPRATYEGTLIEGFSSPRSELKAYFALGKKTLFITLHERTMRKLLDWEKSGGLPTANRKGQSQFGFEVKMRPQGGLSTVVSWLFEDQSYHWRSNSREANLLAEALHFTNADKKLDQEILLDLLGYIPVTRDGFFFEHERWGMNAPSRGNHILGHFNQVPVPGSYTDDILKGLKLAQFQMAFDKEVPETKGVDQFSLSVKVRIKREQ